MPDQDKKQTQQPALDQYGNQGNEGRYGQGQYNSQGKPDPRGSQAQRIQPGQQRNQGKQGDQASQQEQDDQTSPGNQGTSDDIYTYMGLHPEEDFVDEQENTAPDDYGDQDQFGDVDNQDPYSNLYDEDPGSTPGGEDLYDLEETEYGLAEPLAKPGDASNEGTDRDEFGTKGSSDQYGYEK